MSFSYLHKVLSCPLFAPSSVRHHCCQLPRVLLRLLLRREERNLPGRLVQRQLDGRFWCCECPFLSFATAVLFTVPSPLHPYQIVSFDTSVGTVKLHTTACHSTSEPMKTTWHLWNSVCQYRRIHKNRISASQIWSSVVFQEDLTKETIIQQFKIVKSHTNTSHVMQYGNKVRNTFGV